MHDVRKWLGTRWLRGRMTTPAPSQLSGLLIGRETPLNQETARSGQTKASFGARRGGK